MVALVLPVGLLGASGFLLYLKLTGGLSDELDGFFFYLATPSALVIGLITSSLLSASLRKSNWLLRVRHGALILKFRSDSNARLPEPPRRGEKLAAVGLARRTFGFSLAEAKGFVEDLLGPGSEPSP
jgi:hypothetical protein